MGVVVCGGWMGYVATPSTPHTEATQPKQQSKCGTLGALGSSATAGSIGIQSAPVFAAFPHSRHAIASSPLGSCGSRAGYATEYIPWNKETPSCASHGLLISRLGLMARRIRILRQWDIDACPASLILASTLMVLQEMHALLTPVNMLSTLERWTLSPSTRSYEQLGVSKSQTIANFERDVHASTFPLLAFRQVPSNVGQELSDYYIEAMHAYEAGGMAVRNNVICRKYSLANGKLYGFLTANYISVALFALY
ncbi:hypothetical protein IG631_07389 [Alternaria alternata]|nr:hypothetical protein IG631_07389 [Alternaria alternata]